ncbi:Transcriptional regulator [Euzebya pacifica]|uniref:Transcriptional regulator n=1 Tax=Euzebya pacifica TaxID=1608957 RepID=A0A346XU92_9ACTN|nr:Transcriptional regulator [Euzebya pacifica]
MVRLMERHGILVVRAALSTRRANAFSYDFGDRPVAVLGTEKANTLLSRFDAAHELGHLVMHHEAEPGDGKLESQAHAFAAGLLMPRRLVEPLLPATFTVSELIAFAHTWGVSIAAALYRARSLGVMSDSVYRRAVTWMSAQGYRRDETALVGDVGPPEQPILLQRAVELLADMEGLTVSQSLAARHLDIDVLQQLLNSARPSVEL